jgi:hypothetical protein
MCVYLSVYVWMYMYVFVWKLSYWVDMICLHWALTAIDAYALRGLENLVIDPPIMHIHIYRHIHIYKIYA